MGFTGDKFSCFVDWSTADEVPRSGANVTRSSGLARMWAIPRGSSNGSEPSVRHACLTFFSPPSSQVSFLPQVSVEDQSLSRCWETDGNTHPPHPYPQGLTFT